MMTSSLLGERVTRALPNHGTLLSSEIRECGYWWK